MKPEPAESPARRALRPVAAILILVAACAILALWFAWATSPDEGPSAAPVASAASPPAASLAPASPQVPLDPDNLPPAVERYLESTVYPPGTGRLTTAQDDLLHPNQRYEDFRRIIDTYSENPNEVVSARLTSDHFFFTGDEIVRLKLQLKRGSVAIPALSVEADAVREGRDGSEGNAMPIRFHRESEGLIAELDSARFADHHGPILVKARIEYERGAFYDESLRFFYTPANRVPARFTGQFRDSLRNGSLEVGVELDIDQPGFYRVDANLYDASGKPISFAAFKGNLDSGKRYVPIQFFGRVLRDANASGPYRVDQIRGYRFLESEYPDRERLPDYAGHHQTARYSAQQFSTDEYDSEHKRRMLALLLEDVARGISIDRPPPAQGARLASPTTGTD